MTTPGDRGMANETQGPTAQRPLHPYSYRGFTTESVLTWNRIESAPRGANSQQSLTTIIRQLRIVIRAAAANYRF
jgi:hypothetical protein